MKSAARVMKPSIARAPLSGPMWMDSSLNEGCLQSASAPPSRRSTGTCPTTNPPRARVSTSYASMKEPSPVTRRFPMRKVSQKLDADHSRSWRARRAWPSSRSCTQRSSAAAMPLAATRVYASRRGCQNQVPSMSRPVSTRVPTVSGPPPPPQPASDSAAAIANRVRARMRSKRTPRALRPLAAPADACRTIEFGCSGPAAPADKKNKRWFRPIGWLTSTPPPPFSRALRVLPGRTSKRGSTDYLPGIIGSSVRLANGLWTFPDATGYARRSAHTNRHGAAGRHGMRGRLFS